MFNKIKKFFSKNNINISIDKSCQVGKYIYISKDSKIGKYCYINDYTRITKAKIGNFVSIGNNVAIGQGEHDLNKLSTSTYFLDNAYDKLTQKECIIKNDVWIGSYAFIKRGVTIGNGAVIGTHAVVTKDVPDFAVVAGVPAKVIRYRFDEETIQKLLKLKWWDMDIEFLKKHKDVFEKDVREVIKILDNFDKRKYNIIPPKKETR